MDSATVNTEIMRHVHAYQEQFARAERAEAEVDRWRAEAESWHAQYLRVFAETLVLAERVSALEAELRSAKEGQ